jgi:hypothetical protein
MVVPYEGFILTPNWYEPPPVPPAAVPFPIPSIKILFEKIVLGETKTLQFANMSMRDLKL